MSYMKTVMNLDSDQADMILGIALLFATPFFVVFGKLSDRVGRKWVMLTGMLLAVLTYRPIYEAMYQVTNLQNKTELVAPTKSEPVQVPTEGGYDKTTTSITTYSDGTVLKSTEIAHFFEDGGERKNSEGVNTVVKNTVHIEGANYFYLIFLIFIQFIYITLVDGPIAAFLVEISPLKICNSSMSLPYHIGNGIF